MRHKSLSYEKLQNLIHYYQQQPIDKLKQIEAKWAYGKDSKKLLDIDLKDKKRYAFFLAKPNEIVLKADFGNFDIHNLFTGIWNNDNRIARLLYGWENNYFVDPPIIWLTHSIDKKISFGDGRRRTKLSFHLGYAQIPIAVDREEFDEISSIIRLKLYRHKTAANRAFALLRLDDNASAERFIFTELNN